MARGDLKVIWRPFVFLILVVVPQPLLLMLLRIKLNPFQLDQLLTWEIALPSHQGETALGRYVTYGNSTSSLCGGIDVSPLSDGTRYGWTGGTIEACAEKCTSDPACDAFERWSSDGGCHWKRGATTDNSRLDFPVAGHSCYLQRSTKSSHGAATIINPDAVETRIECDGYCCNSLVENNRSCHYSNLYLEVTASGEGQFWAFVVAGRETNFTDSESLATAQETRTKCQGPFPPNVRSISRPWKFKPRKTVCSTENLTSTNLNYTGFESIFTGPKLKVFATKAELQAHVESIEKLETRPHVHVQFNAHSNWGHHTMENMYAAWMATSKFGLENRTVCFVHAAEQVDELDPASTFGGCPSLSWEELTAEPFGRWIHFDDWVFGISGGGMMHRTRHYEASMSKPGDEAMYLPALFRYRMFDRYSVKQPLPRSVSNKYRPRYSNNTGRLLRALIVPNKRDWGDLSGITSAINQKLRQVELAGEQVTVVAQILDWKRHGTFRQQLELLGETDIYVSCVGTALTLQTFLPDGSVVVNVGWEDGFWDEYITAANRWLDAVYPSSLGTSRSSDEVIMLVVEAATRIMRGFNIPVPRGQALSPYGKAFSSFLRSEEGESLHILPTLNAQYQWDGSFGGNKESGACYGVVGHATAAYHWVCGPFNERCQPPKDFMLKLRQEYNVSCPKKNTRHNPVTIVKNGKMVLKRNG